VRDLSRRGSRAVRVGLVGALAVAAGLGLAMAQFNQNNNPVGDQQEPYVAHEMQARQLKRLREEHQKEVFSDTKRLLQLATELKAQVDKGNKPTPDVLKDVDEIGKLAKRVSERIKTQ
jgi:uncharacterized protein HemX